LGALNAYRPWQVLLYCVERSAQWERLLFFGLVAVVLAWGILVQANSDRLTLLSPFAER
jgi:hypothetical protein